MLGSKLFDTPSYDDSTILGDNTIIGGHFAGNSAAETDVQPQINSDF